MWEFINQNWVIILLMGLMIFMHTRGAGGCCGVGHRQNHSQNAKNNENVISEKEGK